MRLLERDLRLRTAAHSEAATVRVEMDARIRHTQGYRLAISPNEIAIGAATPAGVSYAMGTLRQLVAQAGSRLPCLEIQDWPDVPRRGVLLDISRDKVPTMRSLRETVDWLASLKINELQLYMEHTFAYRRHRQVWRDASPLTAAEVRQLDTFCRERFIELVPCQNTLGHMERWLKHARYAPLAEATGPWRSPFGDIRTTKSTLNPTDRRTLALVRALLDELLPCFSSRRVNVNCDEPFELGQGRSAAICRRRGIERVFVDYVAALRRIVSRHRRRMMCWADVLSNHPRALGKIPRDITLLEWGYEADHPFMQRCKAIGRAGFEFYVCPGTSSWCSFAGRTTIALTNLRVAARAAVKHGAAGFLVTDWGDFGHRQYWPASKVPIVYGASVAWNVAGPPRDLSRTASAHGFGDSSGEAAGPWLALGDVYRLTGAELRNKTALFCVMQSRLDDRSAISGLTATAIRRVRQRIDAIERRARPIARRTREQRLVAAELAMTIRVLRHACARAEAMLDIAGGRDVRSALARLRVDAKAIARLHGKLWLARNRPGGLSDSVAHYLWLVDEYAEWGRRAQKRRAKINFRSGRA